MFISAESQVKGGNLLTPASFTSIKQVHCGWSFATAFTIPVFYDFLPDSLPISITDFLHIR
jgi:hypothetical protein